MLLCNQISHTHHIHSYRKPQGSNPVIHLRISKLSIKSRSDHQNQNHPIPRNRSYLKTEKKNIHILLTRSGTAAMRPSVRIVGNVSSFEDCCCCCRWFCIGEGDWNNSLRSLLSAPISATIPVTDLEAENPPFSSELKLREDKAGGEFLWWTPRNPSVLGARLSCAEDVRDAHGAILHPRL